MRITGWDTAKVSCTDLSAHTCAQRGCTVLIVQRFVLCDSFSKTDCDFISPSRAKRLLPGAIDKIHSHSRQGW